jgi:hypothetical protein
MTSEMMVTLSDPKIRLSPHEAEGEAPGWYLNALADEDACTDPDDNNYYE